MQKKKKHQQLVKKMKSNKKQSCQTQKEKARQLGPQERLESVMLRELRENGIMIRDQDTEREKRRVLKRESISHNRQRAEIGPGETQAGQEAERDERDRGRQVVTGTITATIANIHTLTHTREKNTERKNHPETGGVLTQVRATLRAETRHYHRTYELRKGTELDGENA